MSFTVMFVALNILCRGIFYFFLFDFFSNICANASYITGVDSYKNTLTFVVLPPFLCSMIVMQSREAYKIQNDISFIIVMMIKRAVLNVQDALHLCRDLNLFTRTNLLYLSSSFFAVRCSKTLFFAFVIDIQKQPYLV